MYTPDEQIAAATYTLPIESVAGLGGEAKLSGVARIPLVGRKGDAWDVPLLEFHWQLISEKVPAPRF